MHVNNSIALQNNFTYDKYILLPTRNTIIVIIYRISGRFIKVKLES